jgi:hypothetical protein
MAVNQFVPTAEDNRELFDAIEGGLLHREVLFVRHLAKSLTQAESTTPNFVFAHAMRNTLRLKLEQGRADRCAEQSGHLTIEVSLAVLTTQSVPRPFGIVERPIAAEVWLWPNLLSLQAPLVAVLWQLLLARSTHVRLNPFEPWALGLAVWLIYLTDHLIDTARPAGRGWEPPRKDFCRKHWRKFLVLAVGIGFVLISFVNRLLWAAMVRVGWRLSLGVACYFALIHLAPANWRRGWPRDAAVAVFFAFGTFIAVWLANGRDVVPLLLPGALFMLLCWANCSLIETWEWQASGSPASEVPNQAAGWVAEHLLIIGALIALLSAVFGLVSLLPREFAVAPCLSGASLALLSIYRRAIPARFVSPAADLALCAPAIVLPFLRLH